MLPKPEGISAARWATIERNVKRRCHAKYGTGERADKCIYGTLNRIKELSEKRRAES